MPRRRDMLRRLPTSEQLDNMARITFTDIDHAAATWRQDAPRAWRGNLELPAYEGDGLPSDVEREP